MGAWGEAFVRQYRDDSDAMRTLFQRLGLHEPTDALHGALAELNARYRRSAHHNL